MIINFLLTSFKIKIIYSRRNRKVSVRFKRLSVFTQTETHFKILFYRKIKNITKVLQFIDEIKYRSF